MEYSLKLLPTAWSTPIVPHAFPMVCRVYHTCYIPKKHDVILIAHTEIKSFTHVFGDVLACGLNLGSLRVFGLL